jgi:hypothetical protein
MLFIIFFKDLIKVTGQKQFLKNKFNIYAKKSL